MLQFRRGTQACSHGTPTSGFGDIDDADADRNGENNALFLVLSESLWGNGALPRVRLFIVAPQHCAGGTHAHQPFFEPRHVLFSGRVDPERGGGLTFISLVVFVVFFAVFFGPLHLYSIVERSDRN